MYLLLILLVEDMSHMFEDCNNFEELNAYNFKTINIKNMDFMFSKTIYIKKIDISKFDTSKY